MTNLSTKIKLYANREVDFRTDVILQDNSVMVKVSIHQRMELRYC
jgi:hypothetical protein